MLLDPVFVVDNIVRILFFCAVVVVTKLIATGVASLVLKRPIAVAAASAFLLAQIGEFSFILQKVGADAGLAPADAGEQGTQTFIAVAVILIAITPFLYHLGRAARRRIEHRDDIDSAQV